MEASMQLVVLTNGIVRCVYDELIDLACLGQLQIRRASFVEPDADGMWQVDLSLSGGPRLGPFTSRSLALQAERHWLEDTDRPAGARCVLLTD
jgi:hypothetical protein